jgi:hypothetical protein
MINRKLYDLICNSENDIFQRSALISSGNSHNLVLRYHINRSITIEAIFSGISFYAKFNSYEQLRLQFDKKKDFAMLTFLTLMFIMSRNFGSTGILYCKYLDNYPVQENQENVNTRRITVDLVDTIRNSVLGNIRPNYIRSEALTTISSERMNNIESELGRLQEAINIFGESLNGELRRRFEALNEREN